MLLLNNKIFRFDFRRLLKNLKLRWKARIDRQSEFVEISERFKANHANWGFAKIAGENLLELIKVELIKLSEIN